MTRRSSGRVRPSWREGARFKTANAGEVFARVPEHLRKSVDLPPVAVAEGLRYFRHLRGRKFQRIRNSAGRMKSKRVGASRRVLGELRIRSDLRRWRFRALGMQKGDWLGLPWLVLSHTLE